MAFLTPYFSYDVFVSYSHGDLRTPDSPLKRWTVALVRELEADIRSVDTEFDELHIWLDEDIDPTAHLTDELRNKVKSSCILMIFMSPRYLSSSWCKDELAWFREQIVDRSRDQGRVFVIRALPTNQADWPDFLRDERGNSLPGFLFHDPQTLMPYGWRDIREKNEEFVRQLWTLQTALAKRLRELRVRAQTRAMALQTFPQPAGVGRRIYLHARPEYASVCEAVRRRLAEEGVTPLSPIAEAGTQLADWARESKVRIEAAKRCQALALMRADDNATFIGDLFDIGVDERERIQSARGAPMPCAVLDLSGQGLPIDVSIYGIRRFDLCDPIWHRKFRAWLDAAQMPTEGES
jgi:hypothetical protein